MALPLMPKATAVWLVENTTLTFEQIAEFCGMHQLEIQAIADDEVAIGMRGLDPITSGQLTPEEIDRCQTDSNALIELAKPKTPVPKARSKGARYTPVSKRQDRPDAIAWLVKNYPELSDAQISRLIGTTKPTINAVRDKSHWNTPNIKPQSPSNLGLCTEQELEKIIAVARARAGIVHTANPAAEPEDMQGIHLISAEEAAATAPSDSLFEDRAAADAGDGPVPTAASVFASSPEPAAPAPAEEYISAESVFGTKAPAAPVAPPVSDAPPADEAPPAEEANASPDGEEAPPTENDGKEGTPA